MKLKIRLPILVEGKYDKNHLHSLVDAHIISTDGFGIFRENEKKHLIRRLGEKEGLIVLTDSDGAGLVIRNYVNSLLPKDKIHHLYTPQIAGKERRKTAPSKAGYLGVEGVPADILLKLLAPFADDSPAEEDFLTLSKADFYADGFSGRENSAALRKELALDLALPDNLSANALLEAINFLRLIPQYRQFCDKRKVSSDE